MLRPPKEPVLCRLALAMRIGAGRAGPCPDFQIAVKVVIGGVSLEGHSRARLDMNTAFEDDSSLETLESKERWIRLPCKFPGTTLS